MKNILVVVVGLLIMTASGCAHHTPVNVPTGINVYSSYADKIPGKFAIVVDSDPSSLNRTVSPTSYLCSAWTFPVQFSNSFVAGVVQASESIFAEVVDLRVIPTKETMLKDNYRGYVVVRLRHFEPTVRFNPGLFEGRAQATVDIGISFSMKTIDGEVMFSGSANSSRTVDAPGGAACGGGSTALMDAITKATREVLEEYVEKASNSSKMRASLGNAPDPH